MKFKGVSTSGYQSCIAKIMLYDEQQQPSVPFTHTFTWPVDPGVRLRSANCQPPSQWVAFLTELVVLQPVVTLLHGSQRPSTLLPSASLSILFDGHTWKQHLEIDLLSNVPTCFRTAGSGAYFPFT